MTNKWNMLKDSYNMNLFSPFAKCPILSDIEAPVLDTATGEYSCKYKGYQLCQPNTNMYPPHCTICKIDKQSIETSKILGMVL